MILYLRRRILLIRLVFDSISRRMKSFWFTIILCTISLILFAFAVYIYEESQYCEKNSEKILSSGINGTGNLVLINTKFDEITRDFRKEVYDLKEVTAIGVAAEPNYIFFGLKELSQIQSKFIDLENGTESPFGILMENTAVELCRMKLEQGEFIYDKNQDEYLTYLYLGYNLKEIPIGTEYNVMLGKQINLKFIVKGILAKDTRIIDSTVFYGTDAFLTDICYTTMDNLILAICNNSMQSDWLYSIQKDADFESVENKIIDIADKYDLKVYYGRGKDIFDSRKLATKDLNDTILQLFGLITIVCVIVMICMQITVILNNLSEYGILYANGYGISHLCFMQIIENVIKSIFAFIVAEVIARRLLLLSFAGTKSIAEVCNDIYNHHIIYRMAAISFLIVVISSIVPVIVLKKYKPIELIGGNNT